MKKQKFSCGSNDFELAAREIEELETQKSVRAGSVKNNDVEEESLDDKNVIMEIKGAAEEKKQSYGAKNSLECI